MASLDMHTTADMDMDMNMSMETIPRRSGMKRPLAIFGTLAVTAGLLAGTMVAPFVGASSHREAPMIADDPPADLTDVYAFRSQDAPDSVTFIVNSWPFEEPMGGPNYFMFDDKVRYELNISNDGGADPDITYRVAFNTTVKNGDTFLYNVGPFSKVGDANLNVEQRATVTKIQGGSEMTVGSDLPVQPVHIGPRSNPRGVDTQAHVSTLPNGEGMFYAGQRADPFFVDLGVFDLLGLRNPGSNTLKGYNVQTIAFQVPITKLTSNGQAAAADGSNSVIGIWATTARRQTRVYAPGTSFTEEGNFVQVSRLGSPLVNEVVVPIGVKDAFNASKPTGDGQFLPAVQDPELPKLLKLLYNIDAPPAPRDDLVAIFLTGLPGVNKPANVTPSEMLRLNMGIPATAAVGAGQRMGILGGDNAGYPNGRRLEDDTVDISFQAVAGATPFTPAFNRAPNNTLGDSVDVGDRDLLPTFPYVGDPYEGFRHTHHAP